MANHAKGQVRIIGGKWRNTRLPVEDAPGLRPTSDRARETLFNWLQPMLPGARVLDLFAGSGALGLEALSRGAGEVTLVEQDRNALKRLRETVQRFGLGAVRIEATDALAFLRAQPVGAGWDLVFLDPPFHSALLAPALQRIAQRELLAPQGFCYVELPADAELPEVPASWQPYRSGKAGEVGYHLLHHAPSRDLPRNV